MPSLIILMHTIAMSCVILAVGRHLSRRGTSLGVAMAVSRLEGFAGVFVFA